MNWLIGMTLIFTLSALAQEPSELSLENLRPNAVSAFNAQKYEDAEKLFFNLIERDPESADIPYALDFLTKIQVESGNVKSSIQKYHELKESGAFTAPLEWTSLHPPAFDRFKDPKFLSKHLFTLLKVGGILAARTSLISFILDGMNLLEEANYYQNQVQIILDAKENQSNKKRKNISVRPLYYAFPSFYSLLEIPTPSAAELQVVTFPTNDEVVSANLENPAVLEKWNHHLGFALNPEYDSNITHTPSGNSPPQGVSNPSGISENFFINLGSGGNIFKPIIWGWDYRFSTRQFNRSDLKPYSTASHLPSVWISMWNSGIDEVMARYDVAYVRKNGVTPDLYSFHQGPQFSWAHLWNARYRVDVIYGMTSQRDKDDSSRNGTNHRISIQASYPGKFRALRPYFRYDWNRNLSESAADNVSSHSLNAGFGYLLSQYSVVNMSTTFAMEGFPRNETRSDQIKALNIEGIFPISKEAFAFEAGGSYFMHSSNVSSFEYTRWVLKLGLISYLHF